MLNLLKWSFNEYDTSEQSIAAIFKAILALHFKISLNSIWNYTDTTLIWVCFLLFCSGSSHKVEKMLKDNTKQYGCVWKPRAAILLQEDLGWKKSALCEIKPFSTPSLLSLLLISLFVSTQRWFKNVQWYKRKYFCSTDSLPFSQWPWSEDNSRPCT